MIDFDFTNKSFHVLHIIEKWWLYIYIYSVVAPTESADSRRGAESWPFPAVTQGNLHSNKFKWQQQVICEASNGLYCCKVVYFPSELQ